MRTLEITDEQAVLIVDHDGNVSFLPAKGEEAQVTNATTKALALVLQDPAGVLPFHQAVKETMKEYGYPQSIIDETQKIYAQNLDAEYKELVAKRKAK